VTNSIVWGAPTDCVGAVPSGGGNLETLMSCGFTGTNDQQNEDPLLVPLNFYSNLIPTRSLSAGSPAIDHGVDTIESCERDARNRMRAGVPPDGPTFTDSGASDFGPGGTTAVDITSSPVTSASVGAPYSYDVEATNTTRPICIVFSLEEPPEGMTIDSATGVIAWTPASGQTGNHNITVRAADPAGVADEQTFTIAVAP
jgi:hypothetical protein